MELDVNVTAARQLLHIDLVGSPSTYVTVRMLSQDTTWRTRTVESSDAPRYDSEFRIRIWDEKDTLEITVHDNRFFTHGVSLGSVRFQVPQLLAMEHGAEGWYRLSGVKSGELRLNLRVVNRIPRNVRVAVVGGGFSGAAAAYYVAEQVKALGGTAEIVLFEAADDVGGRVGNLDVDGQRVEKGGTGLLDTGRDLFAQLINKFGLKRAQPFDVKAPMGIWNGTEFDINMGHNITPLTAPEFIVNLFLRYGFDLVELLSLNKKYKDMFLHLYDLLTQNKLFQTPGQLVADLGLTELTQMTFAEFLRQKGMNEKLRNELCAAFARANNGLNPDQLTAFVGILGLTLDPSGLYSVEGGNVLMVKKLIEASGARVELQTRVHSIRKVAGDAHAYELLYQKPGQPVSQLSTATFHAVALATPLESAGGLTIDGVHLPPGLSNPRQFLDVHEHWIIGEYNPEFFNQPNIDKVPHAVLTVANPAIPFQNINRIRVLPDGRSLYKVYALGGISDADLNRLFRKIDARAYHRWQYAFPAAAPQPPSALAPFHVDDGFVYSSGLESVFSNIEMQIIVAMNNARLLVKDLCERPIAAASVPAGVPPASSDASVSAPARSVVAAAAAAPSPPAVSGGTVGFIAADTYDVVVVGSGLSGLTAAYQMLRYSLDAGGRPLRVLVLEGTDTVGGRTRSLVLEHEKYHVSYGGTWCMFEDQATLGVSYAANYLPFAPTLVPNLMPNGLHIWNFVLHPYLFFKLWLLGHDISESPSKYADLDALPLSEWLEQRSHDFFCADPKGAKQAVLDWFFQMENFPEDMSYLSTFFAALFLYRRLSHITPTGVVLARVFRYEGGTGELIRALRAEIERLRGVVVASSAVQAIDDSDPANVKVILRPDAAYPAKIIKASSVIAATSVHSTYGTGPDVIQFTPKLPVACNELANALLGWNDPALNVILVFKTPWWMDKGFGGTIYPGAPGMNYPGVYGPVMDLSDHDKKLHKPRTLGVLRIIVKPERCMTNGVLWSKDQIVESAVEFLRPYFGNPSREEFKKDLIEVQIRNWMDWKQFIPFVTFYYPPTKDKVYATHMDLLRKPHGRIIFAGSERALGGAHWMEGAVQRGNETAFDALNALGRIKKSNDYWGPIHQRENAAIAEMKKMLVTEAGDEVKDLFDYVTAPLRKMADGIVHLFTHAQVPMHAGGVHAVPNLAAPVPAPAAAAAASSAPPLLHIADSPCDAARRPMFRTHHLTPHEKEVLQRVLELNPAKGTAIRPVQPPAPK